jgi:hypothetical protein
MKSLRCLARAAQRFPIILDLLTAGEVTLTAIRLLAPHLKPENYQEVLARARHKSKREVELLVATLHPQPDVPSAVRKLPTSRSVTPAPIEVHGAMHGNRVSRVSPRRAVCGGRRDVGDKPRASVSRTQSI